MAFQLKHMAGNHTQQNTRLFSVRNTLLALSIFSSGYAPSGYSTIGDPTDVAIDDPTDFINFRANSTTDNTQTNANVAMDADGDFVVVWQSNGQDTDGSGIYGQRFNAKSDSIKEGSEFNADSIKKGSEFKVNFTTDLDQLNPDVAIDANDDFVVVWQSFGQDKDNFGIFGQRFSFSADTPDRLPKGPEFPVNSTKTADQKNASVAMDADGDFVVVWQSDGNTENSSNFKIYGKRFGADDDDSVKRVEFPVTTDTDVEEINASVAMAANGDFVVVWQSLDNEDDDGYGIFARQFSANGNDAGSILHVNTWTNLDQENPDVSMDADGDFVVVWQSDDQDTDDRFGIYGQRYNANGNRIGEEFHVNKVIDSDQFNPSVAMNAAGDYIITWQSDAKDTKDDSKHGIFGRLYINDVPGDEFLVNKTIDSEQTTPNASMDADGDFIVVWQSDGNTEDTSGFGVFGQRYKGNDETVDLSLIINGPDRVTTGNNFTYELFITNEGDGIAMDIELTGAIPVGVTYVSDDSADAGWRCAPDASTLVCNLPFLNPDGASSTINVTVKSEIAVTHTNVVTVSSAQTDSDLGNNTDTETTASFLDASVSSSNSGGGSLSWWLSGTLFLFALRRKN